MCDFASLRGWFPPHFIAENPLAFLHIIFLAIALRMPLSRFACLCARISRHIIFIHRLLMWVWLRLSHVSISPCYIFHAILATCIANTITSVCVPVCTHFEASHFHSIVHTRLYLRLHSVIFSVCMPVRTHFEACHSIALCMLGLYLSRISCMSCILRCVRDKS